MASYRITALTRPTARLFLQNSVRRHPIRFYAMTPAGNPTGGQMLKSLIIGGVIGAGVGTIYTVLTTEKHIPGSVIEPAQEIFTLDRLPDVKITRRIVNPKDTSGLDLVLFQFQTCPFCCKVRSYLDYSGFSYSVVEVDAVLRQSIKWSPYKKVPILLARNRDGKYIQLNDSSMIISALETYRKHPEKDILEIVRFYPNVTFADNRGQKKTEIFNRYFLMHEGDAPKDRKEDLRTEKDWRSWADDHLVHLISPNVYRSKDEALQTFEWFSDTGEWDVHFPAWERNLMVYAGAGAMYFIAKRLKKRHDLTDDVRSHLYDACDSWVKELEQKKSKFLGGKLPNLGDLAVFGVLSSMEGCQAFKDCLENTLIGPWFYAVKEHVTKNRGNRLDSA